MDPSSPQTNVTEMDCVFELRMFQLADEMDEESDTDGCSDAERSAVRENVGWRVTACVSV